MNPNDVARYSPLGSNPEVKSIDVTSRMIVPPFWTSPPSSPSVGVLSAPPAQAAVNNNRPIRTATSRRPLFRDKTSPLFLVPFPLTGIDTYSPHLLRTVVLVASGPRIERVAQPVADKIESQSRCEK